LAVVCAADPDAAVDQVVTCLNHIQPPLLRLVVASGKETAVRLAGLDERITVAVAPLEKEDAYFSMWVGGCLVIFCNGATLETDNAQWDWLDRELQLGKLCARNVLMVCSRPWITGAPGGHMLANTDEAIQVSMTDSANLVGAAVQRRFLREVQESGVKLIICTETTDASKSVKVGKLEPMESVLVQVQTPRPSALKNEAELRIVRVMPTSVVSDVYRTSEVPNWFALESEGDAETFENDDDD